MPVITCSSPEHASNQGIEGWCTVLGSTDVEDVDTLGLLCTACASVQAAQPATAIAIPTAGSLVADGEDLIRIDYQWTHPFIGPPETVEVRVSDAEVQQVPVDEAGRAMVTVSALHAGLVTVQIEGVHEPLELIARAPAIEEPMA